MKTTSTRTKITRSILVVLAVTAGVFILLGRNGRPVVVTPTEIHYQARGLKGRRVRVRGVVVRFIDKEGDQIYYALEDDSGNRVGLRPGEKVAPLVGRRTTVIGRVAAQPTYGVYVVVQSASADSDN